MRCERFDDSWPKGRLLVIWPTASGVSSADRAGNVPDPILSPARLSAPVVDPGSTPGGALAGRCWAGFLQISIENAPDSTISPASDDANPAWRGGAPWASSDSPGSR